MWSPTLWLKLEMVNQSCFALGKGVWREKLYSSCKAASECTHRRELQPFYWCVQESQLSYFFSYTYAQVQRPHSEMTITPAVGRIYIPYWPMVSDLEKHYTYNSRIADVGRVLLNRCKLYDIWLRAQTLERDVLFMTKNRICTRLRKCVNLTTIYERLTTLYTIRDLVGGNPQTLNWRPCVYIHRYIPNAPL